MRNKYFSSVLLSILLVTSLMVPLISFSIMSQTVSATPGVWDTLAQFPGTVQSDTACYAENSSGAKFIYALESKGAPNRLFRYDIAAGTWSASLLTWPDATSQGSGMVWDGTDNIFVLAGGSTNPNPFRMYQISTNSVTAKTYAPQKANSGSGLAYDGGDNIYALLTSSSSPAASWLYAYSMSSNTWTFLANAPEQMASGSTICKVGAYLYIGGGTYTANPNRYWRWSTTNGWENLASIPENVWGSGSGQEKVNENLIYATKGGTSSAFLRFIIPDNRWDIMENLPATVSNQNDRLAFDGTYLYMIRGLTDNSFWRYGVPKYFEKYCMPDLGQHSVNWCWVASAANSIYWYSQHGYPELIDAPENAVVNDNNYITQMILAPDGHLVYRLFFEIASDCGHVWDEGVYDNEYFYGLQKFINDQGAPLVVHEIVDPSVVSQVPPADGIKVIYRPPTLMDYERELENCQDVLLWLSYRHTETYPYEDTDHVVTGVAFNDNNRIIVSDPWTTGAPDHNNGLENKKYDNLTVISTPDAPLHVYYNGQNVYVPKIVFVSPEENIPVCDVDVIIENAQLEGYPSQWLAYTIDVHNSGNVVDNIILSFVPDGWPDIYIDPQVLINVMPSEHRQATLFVHVPEGALPCTYKDITVVAESQFCGAISSATSVAHVIEEPCGVEVIIENKLLEGYPSQWLEYTIDVHNSGNVVDNIILSFVPDGWPDIYIDPQVLIDVMPSEHRQATLFVHVPDQASPSTFKEIIVVAESQFCGATDYDNALAHVIEEPVCGVDVVIENALLEGYPSQVLEYTISVHNSGNVVDNIILSVIPNEWWPDEWIDPPVLIDVAPCEWRQAKLYVHVSDNYQPCYLKYIEVVAESQFCGAYDIGNALAHVTEPPVCGVDVTIENSLLEGYPSQWLAYTVDVHNSGNFVDNIILSYIPDGWPDITIVPPVLIDVMPSEHRQATVFVHVPDNALECTYKTIIVTAESQFCGATDYDNAAAHVTETPSIGENLYLVTGWNLVCFTAVGASDTPTNIFTGLTYYTDYYLYWWNAPGGPYSIQDPNTVLLDNIAYWVYINTDKTVSTTGTRPTSRDIYCVTGWNMVGFPVVDSGSTPSNVFSPLVYYTDFYLYWWNAPGGPYSIQDPDTPLKDNLGYWTWIDENKMVTVP